jgi:hypothetical protein
MYLSKTKKNIFGFRPLLFLAAGLIYALVIPASALAASASAADKACSKYSSSDLNACESGYDAGHAKKDSKRVCIDVYDGSKQDACLDGFGKGACAIKDPDGGELEKCLNANPIIRTIRIVVNFLSAGVGIVITGSIIVGGIQYAIAGNNPNAVSAAKKRIQDALIALLAFFFIYALLDFLIPGSLLFN